MSVHFCEGFYQEFTLQLPQKHLNVKIKYFCHEFDISIFLSLHAAYENLQSRQETRNSAWLKEGWDATVYYTGRRDGNHRPSPPQQIRLTVIMCAFFIEFNAMYITGFSANCSTWCLKRTSKL